MYPSVGFAESAYCMLTRRGRQFSFSPDLGQESTRETYNKNVQSRIFWVLVTLLSLVADFALPLMWGLLATIPIVFLSWWIAYRSEWF